MLTKSVWACKVRRAICVSSRRQCGSVGVLESRSQGGQSQVYKIRKPRAAAGAGGFSQRSTYVKEGNHSWLLVSATVDGLLGGVRVEPFPPSRQTTPVQSSLTSRRRTGALALFRIGPELTEYAGRLAVVVCSTSTAIQTTTTTHLADAFVVWLHRQHTHNRFRYKTKNTEYPSVEAARAVSHARSVLARMRSSHADCCTALVMRKTPRQQQLSRSKGLSRLPGDGREK